MAVFSLVALILLATIVLRPTRLQEINTRPIRWEPPQEQLTQKPPTFEKLPEKN